MSSVLRARTRLASGSVGLVTRRFALTRALGAASAAAVLALVAGIAVGVRWSARDASGKIGRAHV